MTLFLLTLATLATAPAVQMQPPVKTLPTRAPEASAPHAGTAPARVTVSRPAPTAAGREVRVVDRPVNAPTTASGPAARTSTAVRSKSGTKPTAGAPVSPANPKR